MMLIIMNMRIRATLLMTTHMAPTLKDWFKRSYVTCVLILDHAINISVYVTYHENRLKSALN